MPILLEDFFARFMRKEDLSYKKRLELLEKDVDDLKNSVQKAIDEAQVILNGLKKRIVDLEEEQEWKPRFGDKVRFRHSFFGEMEGIFLEAVFPERWSLMFHDPSCGGSLKHYIADKKDVEKADD